MFDRKSSLDCYPSKGFNGSVRVYHNQGSTWDRTATNKLFPLCVQLIERAWHTVCLVRLGSYLAMTVCQRSFGIDREIRSTSLSHKGATCAIFMQTLQLQKFVFENFHYEDGANSVPGDVMPTFEGFMKVTCGSRHECP